MIRNISAALVLILISIPLIGQTYSGKLVDAKNNSPIPYATITYSGNKGVITNEEGKFSIVVQDTPVDSLFVASMGFDPLSLATKELDGGLIRLKPQTITLSEVFLSNKRLTADEIMERVKAGISKNYKTGLTKKRFFLRESELNTVDQFDLEVEESSIPELNQGLMDSIIGRVSRSSDSYKEWLGDFYGDYERQKTVLLKAANLYDPQETESAEKLFKKLELIFSKNVKKDSYLKIKSGIIGFKVDVDEITNEVDSAKIKIEQAERDAIENPDGEVAETKEELSALAASTITTLYSEMFWKKDATFNIIEDIKKYRFELDGVAYMEESPVYIITFKGKRKPDFTGKIYVNTFDYGVYRIDYENTKNLEGFKLFGISNYKDVFKGKMLFSKMGDGTYTLKYLENTTGERVGVDRPLTIIEKNKNVIGRRKQNELDLEVRLKVRNVEKIELVVFENQPINESEYDSVDSKSDFEYQKFKKYNPEFWEDVTIIAPNAAIQAFTATEGEE